MESLHAENNSAMKKYFHSKMDVASYAKPTEDSIIIILHLSKQIMSLFFIKFFL